MHIRSTLVLSLLLVTACGDGDPAVAPSPDGGAPSGVLLPWQVGNSWTYRVTDNGVVSMKTTTIGAAEPVGGTGPHAALMAYKVTTKKGVMDQTLSWQAPDGAGRVLRYREQSFHESTGLLELEEHWDPAKLHVDETTAHTIKGASWLETYAETKIPADGTPPSTATSRDRWTVLAEDEAVTVPAGTFRAVMLQKAGGSNAKTYWYVRGVGKVKEVGGQTEELVSYQVQP